MSHSREIQLPKNLSTPLPLPSASTTPARIPTMPLIFPRRPTHQDRFSHPKFVVPNRPLSPHISHPNFPIFHRISAQQQQRPWSIMEFRKPAVWTTNWSLFVVSHIKAIPGRQTNSGSTMPRAAHMEGGVIGCHLCITSHSGSTSQSLNLRPTPSFVPHAYHPPPPFLPPP